MGDESGPVEDTLKNIDAVVKWFDPRKGFGFIVGPDGQDIFVHFTSIEGDGFRVLKDASPVTYSAKLTDKGWHATKVVRADVPEIHVRPPVSPASRSPRR